MLADPQIFYHYGLYGIFVTDCPNNGKNIDMKGKTCWIVVNLDLCDAVFAALSPRVPELVGLTGSIHRIDAIPETVHSAEIGLVLMCQRRIDPSMDSIAPALASLDRCEKAFAEGQLKQRIAKILLIDCSEMPNAPMSHFTILSQYLESLAVTAPEASSGSIGCVDYEVLDGGAAGITNIRFWDTQSDEFLEHMRRHMIESLQALNFDLNPATYMD